MSNNLKKALSVVFLSILTLLSISISLLLVPPFDNIENMPSENALLSARFLLGVLLIAVFIYKILPSKRFKVWANIIIAYNIVFLVSSLKYFFI